MKVQNGWGKKTSALFTKSIFHLHNTQYDEKLIIWEDAPKTISAEDKLYLPVDSVIIAIFNSIDASTNWNFDKINALLQQKYNGQQIEIWDDLWFWGFITQKGTGDNRVFEWNENKYWALKETDKNPNVILEIRLLCTTFLNILN